MLSIGFPEMAIFWQLRWFFRMEWRRYLKACLALVVVALLSMVPPWVAGWLIDQIRLDTLDGATLAWTVTGLVVLALVVYVLRVLWRIWLFGASLRLSALLRERLFAHLTRLSPAFYQRHKVGDLMARATNDIEAVQMTAGEGVLSMIDGLLTGVVVLTLMTFLLSWELTLVALLPWPIMGFFMYRFGQAMHRDFQQAQARFSDLNDHVQETLSGVRTIKAYGREGAETQRFSGLTRSASEANLAVARTDSKYEPVIVITMGASFFLSVAYGAWLIVQERFTLGQLTSFTMYLGFLIWPMFAFGWLLNIVERGRVAYQRITSVLETPEPIVNQGQAPAPEALNLSVDIGRFCYPEAVVPALEGLHFSLAPGQTLGLVGSIGSGKTTVFNLLLRLYEASSAKLEVGGRPIADFSLDTLRGLFAYVPQDSYLFSMSIADNIALAAPGASRDAVEEAARLAAVGDDIRRFPDGYDTLVGERGLTLSGGQKQRIAIARALLRQAPGLILDDALSAVDSQTERRILNHLRQARRGTTTLIASHRLSAVEDADRIIVLEQGHPIEAGTHSQLLALNGWYARTYHWQQLEQQVHEGH